MWPDRVSNPGPLALESDMLPTALRGPAKLIASKKLITGEMIANYYAEDLNTELLFLDNNVLEFRTLI